MHDPSWLAKYGPPAREVVKQYAEWKGVRRATRVCVPSNAGPGTAMRGDVQRV